MPADVLILLATAALAVIAVAAAVVAVRAVRQLNRVEPEPASVTPSNEVVPATRMDDVLTEAVSAARPVELAPRVVHGRIIVPPTQAQVVRTALGRPGVRLNVLVHGLRHALTPENRDRIAALMRREYRHRRRERLRAGRLAVRIAKPTAAPTTGRLDRMAG